jgi:hypothetical protein
MDMQKRYSEYILQKRWLAKKIKVKKLWWPPYGTWFNKTFTFTNKKVLDVGCLIESEIYKKFVRDNQPGTKGYFGFDVDDESVKWLKSLEAYFDLYGEYQEELFDYIFLIDVYEHLDATERMNVLHVCNKLLKRKGELVVASPYMENLNYFINGINDWQHKHVHLKSGSEVGAFIAFGDFKFEHIKVYLAGLTMPWLSLKDNLLAILRNLICLYPPFHIFIIRAEKE